MPMEFRHVLVDEENYRNVLGDVARGDLVVDCSVGVDTVAAIELCMERGAMFINSAIEDWMPDGFYEPESEMEESMLFLHGRLRRIGGKESSALVSMGCNPGSVSVWCKLGLEFVAASRWPLKEWKSYGEMARLLGLETVHVSECDT
jgi:homospermidine synthase